MNAFPRWKQYVPFVLPIAVLAAFAYAFLVQIPVRMTNSEETAATSTLSVSMPPAPTSTEQLLARELSAPSIPSEHAEGGPKKIASVDGFNCTGDRESDFDCYEGYYEHVIETLGVEKGVPTVFADLKARAERSSYVLAQCHPLTHVIGRIAAESFADVANAYAKGDSYCWSGYYHGVLETFVNRTGNEHIEEKLNTMCASLNKDRSYSFDYYNCVHGLGHGLMALSDNDIPSSLTKCDSLTGDWEQQSCAGGVYMENVIADGLNHATNWLDPKRPLFPCDISADKYKNTCYLMQTSYMLKINGGDFVKTFAWCRDAGAYQNTCHQSLGRDASGRNSSDLKSTHDICLLGRDQTEITNCVIGAVKDFISYFHSDAQGITLCKSFDEPIRQTCLDTARVYYIGF
jgi:hypothetical protein